MSFHRFRLSPRLGLAVWVIFLILVLAGLETTGHGALRAPALAHPEQLGAWMAGRRVSTIAFAGLRLIAMGLAWYLLATTAIGVILRSLDLVRWRRLADTVTLPGVRQLLAGAVGLSVGTASLMGTASQAGAATGRGGPAGRVLPAVTAVTAAPLDPGSGALMTRLPDGPSTAPPPTHGPPAASARFPPATTDRVPLPQTWVVRHGDNLWSVAEHHLAGAWGRTPTDSEIDRYWLRLVEMNRFRLADPGNPDLIFAGQVFELPPP